MKRVMLLLIGLPLLFLSLHASAAQPVKLSDNAALRYWAAFSEMQDWALTEERAKQLKGILDGSVPYDDSQFGQLVEKNQDALEVMVRGTTLPTCDWGLDYGLGDNTPVEYVRNAFKLGRFNVLDALHLATKGDNQGATQALSAGIRFSHDVANGGSLFATIVSKDLLIEHFRAIEELQQANGFSPAELATLKKAVVRLGPEGLDWETAIRMEMALLNRPEWQNNVPLDSITEAYVKALRYPSTLPEVEKLLASVPLPLREVIPPPKEAIAQMQELEGTLKHVRALLQIN